MTEASVPRPVAVASSSVTAWRSVTSQLTIAGVIPSSSRVAAAVVNRSCLTSQRTSAWSWPTTFAVARPMPPAPPVITDTRSITGPYTQGDFGRGPGLARQRRTLRIVVGMAAVPDGRPEERRPHCRDHVAAIDDQPDD